MIEGWSEAIIPKLSIYSNNTRTCPSCHFLLLGLCSTVVNLFAVIRTHFGMTFGGGFCQDPCSPAPPISGGKCQSFPIHYASSISHKTILLDLFFTLTRPQNCSLEHSGYDCPRSSSSNLQMQHGCFSSHYSIRCHLRLLLSNRRSITAATTQLRHCPRRDSTSKVWWFERSR